MNGSYTFLQLVGLCCFILACYAWRRSLLLKVTTIHYPCVLILRYKNRKVFVATYAGTPDSRSLTLMYSSSHLLFYTLTNPLSTMNRIISLLLIVVALAASSVQGFAPSSLGGVSGGECCDCVGVDMYHVNCNSCGRKKMEVTIAQLAHYLRVSICSQNSSNVYMDFESTFHLCFVCVCHSLYYIKIYLIIILSARLQFCRLATTTRSSTTSCPIE